MGKPPPKLINKPLPEAEKAKPKKARAATSPLMEALNKLKAEKDKPKEKKYDSYGESCEEEEEKPEEPVTNYVAVEEKFTAVELKHISGDDDNDLQVSNEEDESNGHVKWIDTPSAIL